MIVQDHICILLETISCFRKVFLDGNRNSHYDFGEKRKEIKTMESVLEMLEKLTVGQKKDLIAFLRSLEETERNQSPCVSRQETSETTDE